MADTRQGCPISHAYASAACCIPLLSNDSKSAPSGDASRDCLRLQERWHRCSDAGVAVVSAMATNSPPNGGMLSVMLLLHWKLFT